MLRTILVGKLRAKTAPAPFPYRSLTAPAPLPYRACFRSVRSGNQASPTRVGALVETSDMESDNGRVHSKTDASGSSSLCASKDYQAGDVVCKFKVKKNHPEASMYTLQIGSSTHVEVEPDELRFCNHSCDPNVFIDCVAQHFVALKDLADGDAITFFYPSTEWDMGSPFTCSCGASNCLGRIEGARSTDRQLLQNYRLNNHILNQLDVSPEASQAKKHEASQAMSPEASQAKKSEPSQEASPWPRQSTEGRMFMYHSRDKLVAFEWATPTPTASNSPTDVTRLAVFVPGLTDGLMGCPYLNQLAASLWVDSKTRLVQPLLSSSYAGYGSSSVKRDAEQIVHLVREHYPYCRHLLLVGHSTGCQDMVHVCRLLRQEPLPQVKHVGCVLQAPVSDRFYMSHFDSENYEKAMRVVEACPAPEKTLLPMELYEVPITVARFASLGGKCTSDDLFSADLSDDELRKQLNSLMEHEDAVRVASLWAFSGADECVPSDGSVDQAQLGGRLIQLVGQECAQLLVVGDANHNLSSSETHQSLFVEGVISFWNAEMAR